MMINHWIGGSPLCLDFHDWLRNGTLATASPVVVLVLPRALELLGASEANYVSKKMQKDIVVSEWVYISFTLKFGHLNMKSDHELVDGTGTHTCPVKAAVLERIPQASPFKILSCKEPTKVLLSPRYRGAIVLPLLTRLCKVFKAFAGDIRLLRLSIDMLLVSPE